MCVCVCRYVQAVSFLYAQAVSFLKKEYTEARWFWEVLELCRKEILAGFLLLVPQRLNFLRIVLGLLVSICYLVLLHAARPFHRASTSFVAILTNLSLCCTLLAALLVKVIDVDFKQALLTND